jgi:hypothetical protein
VGRGRGFPDAEGMGGRMVMEGLGGGRGLLGVADGNTVDGLLGLAVTLPESATVVRAGRWWELAMAVPPSHTPAATATAAPDRPSVRVVRRFLRSVMKGPFCSVRTPPQPPGHADRLSWTLTDSPPPATLGPTSVEVTRELPHGAGAMVLGDCAAVYLWLWGRQGDDAIRVNGDRRAVAVLRAALAAAPSQPMSPVNSGHARGRPGP